ncbi:hypothetical protein B0T17DRAFT_273058 [Bombardia bombarda]|uniref:Uncharacterized protein n=1 Tax=Bombardia bombarda TaxID=252184 RepID=A0AA39X1B8_9PEZI|nr:hypothetical protein B0T17DRAFT_273058 [Bombardia bombarda]
MSTRKRRATSPLASSKTPREEQLESPAAKRAKRSRSHRKKHRHPKVSHKNNKNDENINSAENNYAAAYDEEPIVLEDWFPCSPGLVAKTQPEHQPETEPELPTSATNPSPFVVNAANGDENPFKLHKDKDVEPADAGQSAKPRERMEQWQDLKSPKPRKSSTKRLLFGAQQPTSPVQAPEAETSEIEMNGADENNGVNDNDNNDESEGDDKNDENEEASSVAGDSQEAPNDMHPIQQQLASLDEKLTVYPDLFGKEMRSIRRSITALEGRRQCDEARAALRFDILFNTLKKVSQDVNYLRLRGKDNNNNPGSSAPVAASPDHTATPLTDKARRAKMKKEGATATATANNETNSPRREKSQRKKTMEQCLKLYTEHMNKAENLEDVRKTGKLCVQYAEDLFKTCI